MKNTIKKVGVGALMLVVGSMAMAGTDTTFALAVTTLTDWLEGSMGVMLALAFVTVGLVAGIARQSLIAFAVGIGGALGISIAPGLLAGIFSAGLPL